MLTVRLSWISGCRPGVQELLLSPPPFWKCGDFLQCGGEEERRGEGPQSNTCRQPASHQSDLFVRTTAGCCQRSQFAVYNWTVAGIIGQPPDCALHSFWLKIIRSLDFSYFRNWKLQTDFFVKTSWSRITECDDCCLLPMRKHRARIALLQPIVLSVAGSSQESMPG